mgnify:CR=1 FL=1
MYAPVRVKSSSMRPSLSSGDRVIVDRRASFNALERGDIIVFRIAPRAPGVEHRFRRDGGDTMLMVKRVVALPGERIEAHAGVVVTDNTNTLDEPYLKGNPGSTEVPATDLDDDEVFVLGDNRDHSVDSRVFGPVPRREIVGVVSWRVWPFDGFGSVS